jgi:cytochrome c553
MRDFTTLRGVLLAGAAFALIGCNQQAPVEQAENAAPAVDPAAAAAMQPDTMATGTFAPPAWAYPVMDPGFQRPPEDGTKYTREGSTLSLTMTEINDPFNPPDWYPNEHPPMPQVVAHGRMPDVRACGQCHMPHGMGHPESSSLAGLPANYIVEQMAAYKGGTRKSSVPARSASMITIASAATDEEVKAAAEYFASLKPVKWVRIEEAVMVPTTYVGAGNMRHAHHGEAAGTEPLGNRIIEIPEDTPGAELRDSHSPFMAYVPVGSVAKGEELVKTGGGGKTIQCSICHGPDLRGLGDVPSIIGRSPIYLARQLYDIKHGARTGAGVELMKAVVANLTDEDIIAIAAYTTSVGP